MKMKKMPFLATCALYAALALPSCSDGKSGTTPETGGGDSENNEEVTVTPTEGVTTEAYYKGDLYGTGSGNLWINFISDMELDDFTGDYTGPGYVLCLDFNTILAENADFASLAEGTYTCDYTSDSHEAFTLNIADGDSFFSNYDEDGLSSSLEIAGGTVEVSVKSGYYCLEADLQLEDGSAYRYSFVGEISFINRSEEGYMSNLTEDKELEGMSQALMAYQGSVFTATSDLYTVIIAGPDYDLDSNFGQSDALMLSVNVSPGSSEGIPSGTYTVIDAMEADDYEVNTILSGVYEPAYGGYFGTWYFSTSDKTEASLRNGTVQISNNGNDSYTFTIDMQDGYGHKISGTYTGKCRIEDWS